MGDKMSENKSTTPVVLLFAVSAVTLVLFSLGACTASKPGANPSLTASGVAATRAPVELNSEKSVPGPAANFVCNPYELALFDRQDGEVVDLDRDILPAGIFLASNIEMLIEKKNETGSMSRVLLREAVAGKNAEILCSEGVEKFGPNFEMALSGLAKFETSEKSPATGFVLRQFFFFQNRTGHGLIVSNPGLPNSAVDLKNILQHHGSTQLIRLGEKSYLVKYLRERDGVRARMLIHLDVI